MSDSIPLRALDTLLRSLARERAAQMLGVTWPVKRLILSSFCGEYFAKYSLREGNSRYARFG